MTVLAEIERQVQASLATGSGRWIVAGLGLLGKAQLEMENYLLSAPAPAGMDEMAAQFRSIMQLQSKQYASNADNFFAQCSKVAEENEIVSHFVSVCQSRGRREVEELQSWATLSTRRRHVPPDVMQQLLKNSRAIQTVTPRFAQAKASGSLGTAELILSRIIEIEGDTAELAAEMGWLYLESKQYQRALDQFQAATKKSRRHQRGEVGQSFIVFGNGIVAQISNGKE